MPNTELLLILAVPDSALCLLSVYQQRKLVGGAGVSSPSGQTTPQGLGWQERL